MKTKELIKKLEFFADGRGYYVAEDDKEVRLYTGHEDLLLSVDKRSQYHVETNRQSFHELSGTTKQALFDLVTEYAQTPLEEREEEKKYVYKFPFNIIYETKKDLYVFKILDGGLNLSSAAVHDPTINNRYHFTDKEVEKFTGKDRALFNACEKIEVTP